MEEIERSKFIDDDQKTRKVVALLSWIIVLFVPTYAVVITSNNYGPLTETTYMWPWMVLVHLVPKKTFVSDQFVVSGFPWTFVYFLPFLYIIKLNWELYNSSEDRMKKIAFSAVATAIQVGIIAMTFESQSPLVNEEKTIYYIPQIILLVMHLTLSVIWYFEEIQAAMQVSKLKKERARSQVKNKVDPEEEVVEANEEKEDKNEITNDEEELESSEKK